MTAATAPPTPTSVDAGGAVRVWMRAERQDGRTVLVLRDRLIGVNLRRPVAVEYPGGRRGQVRLLGFDEGTVAVPLDNQWRVGAVSAARWWPAALLMRSAQSARLPGDLVAALVAAGKSPEAFLAGQGWHASQWVRSAVPGPVRVARVAAVVESVVGCGQ